MAKITENSLLMLTDMVSAVKYVALCEDALFAKRVKTAGTSGVNFTSALILHHIAAKRYADGIIEMMMDENYWCVVVSPPAWEFPHVIQRAWDRLRSRFMGDDLIGEPGPKMIFTLDGGLK